MTCRAIERLLLESDDRTLDGDERRAVEEHLGACSACRAFLADRRRIRGGLGEVDWPALPSSLGRRTRGLCLEAMNRGLEAGSPSPAGARVPVLVVAASIFFVVLVAIWLTGVLADVDPDLPLPPIAWAAIAFLAQNAFVLLVSPVIFRAARISSRRLP